MGLPLGVETPACRATSLFRLGSLTVVFLVALVERLYYRVQARFIQVSMPGLWQHLIDVLDATVVH